jgi:hypothetical protein
MQRLQQKEEEVQELTQQQQQHDDDDEQHSARKRAISWEGDASGTFTSHRNQHLGM